MIPELSFKSEFNDYYDDSSTDEEMEDEEEVDGSTVSLRTVYNKDDSSSDEECQLDECLVQKLNCKLCSYEQSDSSEGEEVKEETEVDNMIMVDARINRDTFEVEDAGDGESSSEDEFDKEMDGELDEKVGRLEGGMGRQEGSGEEVVNGVCGEEFYDPREDEKDQAWVDQTRMGYLMASGRKNNETINKQKTLTNNKRVTFNDESSGTNITNTYTSDATTSTTSTINSTKTTTNDKATTTAATNSKKTRKNIKSTKTTTAAAAKMKLPNSDAVLNCPCCMRLLCLDCQRHDTYMNQYRAMFVTNCVVAEDEVVNIPEKSKKRKRAMGGRKDRWKGGNGGMDEMGGNGGMGEMGGNGEMEIGGVNGESEKIMGNGVGMDREGGEGMSNDGGVEMKREGGGVMGRDDFRGVECGDCGTRVAMLDVEDVYHFFNVLSSH